MIRGSRAVLAVLVALLGVAGAAWPDEPRTVVVVVDHALPPFAHLDAAGRPVGYAVDLITEIGRVMDFKPEIRPAPWTEAVNAILGGAASAIAGMAPTAAREGDFDFTAPFMNVSYALFTHYGGALRGPRDLPGRTLAVRHDDITAEYAASAWPDARLVSVRDAIDALRGVAAGRFDAALLPRLNALHLIESHGLLNVQPVGGEVIVQPLAFAVRDGDTAVRALLDEGLVILRETGRLDELRTHWFGVAPGRPPPPRAMVAAIAAGLALLLLGGGLWTWALRRQVQRKTAELAAEAGRRRTIEEIIDRSPVVVAVHRLDDDLTPLYVSGSVRRFGFDPAAMLGGGLLPRDYVLAEDYARLQAMIRQAIDGGRDEFDLDFRVRDGSGAVRWFDGVARVQRDADGRPSAMEALSVDVTDRRRIERDLRDSNERARVSFQMSPDAIVIVRVRDSVIVDVNMGFEHLTGWRAAEVIGRPVPEMDLWVRLEDRARMEDALARDGTIRNYEAEFRHRSGRIGTGLLHSAIVVMQGEPHYLSIVREVSEIKAARQALENANDELELRVVERTRALQREIVEREYAERALQEANELLERRVVERTRALESEVAERARAEAAAALANRAKTEFLANVSHELRTPLNSIIGFSDVLAGERFGPLGRDAYVEYAHDINNAGKHLLEIINDILDVSRLETGSLGLEENRFDVRLALRACRRLVRDRAEARGIALTFEAPADLPALRADERRFKQIIINLVSNALKFTPEGGTVTVGARLGAGDAFEFEVADSGIGIPPDRMEAVMATFGQADGSISRRYEGVGIGLPLSARLAELHGARLSVASAVGAGTRVTVRFPPERTERLPQHPPS